MLEYSAWLWTFLTCCMVCPSFVLGSHVHLRVFSEILKREGIQSAILMPVETLQNVIDIIFSRIRCNNDIRNLLEDNDNSTDGERLHNCTKTICVDTRQIIVQSGGDVSHGLMEEQFLNTSVILLFYVINANQICHHEIDASTVTGSEAHAYLTNLISEGKHLKGLMDVLENVLSQNNTSKKMSYNRSINDRGSSDETVNYDESTKIPDNIKEKCISVDALYYYMNKDGKLTSNDIRYLSSVIIYLIYIGSEPAETCKLATNKTEHLQQNGTHLRNGIKLPGGKPLGDKPVDTEMPGKIHISHKLAHPGREGERSLEENRTDCHTASLLLALYESDSVTNKRAFQDICPRIKEEWLYAHCQKLKSLTAVMSDMEKYGYGILAITVISLCSTTGAIILPCFSSERYGNVMSLFLGLASGTLLTDAVLHLIPMALGLHDHEEECGHELHPVHNATDKDEHGDFIYSGMVIIGGIYAFFILEIVMTRYGWHSQHPRLKDSTEMAGDPIHSYVDLSLLQSSEREESIHAVSPLAVMMVLGDAIHNFADGLAVGAAFEGSSSLGVATSIAVFAHELPHELGDFAVLIKSGMSFRSAVIVNFAEAMPAYIGLLSGLTVSTIDHMKEWIFSLTAGIFLYIALVDLFPQQIKVTNKGNLILCNCGILSGVLIMFLLALFEDYIVI